MLSIFYLFSLKYKNARKKLNCKHIQDNKQFKQSFQMLQIKMKYIYICLNVIKKTKELSTANQKYKKMIMKLLK